MLFPNQVQQNGQSAHTAEANTKIHLAHSIAPAISYSPTDVTIPPKLYKKVPNLEHYKKLQQAEQQLDLFIAQKGLDFQSIQAVSMQPYNIKKETGNLRVFIYNTCDKMPWQQKNHEEMSDRDSSDSTWTLRIEGRFISDDKSASPRSDLKFSSFLSGLSVEIIPNGDYPNFQNNPSNLIEWRDPSLSNGENPLSANFTNASSQYLFDGIDVKRPGVFNISTKIAILVKDFSSRLVLSPMMSQFTGKKEASQQDLVYQIWQYVLFKNLFKESNGLTKVPAVSASGIANQSIGMQGDDEKDISLVKCDPTLRALLKCDHFTFKDLHKLIQPHLRPKEPIIIDYEVDTTRSSTLGDVVIDIPIELPISLSKVQKEIIEENKKAFEVMSKSDERIQFLNQRLSLGIAALNNVSSRELFYRELSEDPVGFMKKWLVSQSETLKALKSEEGYNEETVRRAEFFKENEELLRQKIELILGAQKL